ncbi:MAG TPA: phasin [Beijerinckiaceae bacterium]|jgi:phasin
MNPEFPTQIPAEMREFAERSVVQARKAFEGFMGAIQKASGDVEGAAASAQTNVKDASRKAVTFAEQSVTSAFDLAERLVHAKDVQEVMRLQAEYLQQQLAAVQEQARELGDAVSKASGVKK